LAPSAASGGVTTAESQETPDTAAAAVQQSDRILFLVNILPP
jgi:hypothetical protein